MGWWVMIKIEKADLSLERRIAVAMVTDPDFLAGVGSMWRDDLIHGLPDWLSLIGRWCLDYWKRYGKSPGRDIESIYHTWSLGEDEEKAKVLAGVFRSISKEFEIDGRVNTQYLLDQTHALLTRVGLVSLSQRISGFVSQGDLAGAEGEVMKWRRPERIASIGGDPLLDEVGWRAAFAEIEDPLFIFPGSLGELIGPIGRGEFASFLGPEKRGKTWWLLFTAMRALENRCRVAYFQLGDLTQEQVYRRLGVYLTGRSNLLRHCVKQWAPVMDCRLNQSGECDVPKNPPLEKDDSGEPIFPDVGGNLLWEPCTRCRNRGRDGSGRRWYGASWIKLKEDVEPLRWEEAWEAVISFREKVRGRLRMHFSPNNSIRVSDMEKILDRWEREDGFIPDVVVGDYWDLIRPEDSRMEVRHQQNDNWSRGRGLSMDRRVALITATQADAKSYEVRDLKAKNFSEDKRKYGHVTLGMWTLNQTKEEKRNRLMRIGRLFVREDDFYEKDYCHVLMDLSAGRPYVAGWRGRGG